MYTIKLKGDIIMNENINYAIKSRYIEGSDISKSIGLNLVLASKHILKPTDSCT